FDGDDKLRAIEILESEDTRDHVQSIRENTEFLPAFLGHSREKLADLQVDGVSGATLTCIALREAIALRLKGASNSLRFPDLPTLADLRKLEPKTAKIEHDDDLPSRFWLMDSSNARIGQLIRSTPYAEELMGYQGPSETWLLLDAEQKLRSLAVANSFDNEPYVSYVREDEYFASLFQSKTLVELAGVDPMDSQIEGVSGATMTSLAVADGIFLTAKEFVKEETALADRQSQPLLSWTVRDVGTAAVIFFAMIVGLTRMRGNKYLRLALQLSLIVYLGLINGDMISQAMIVGWTRSGIPWQTAGGLSMLSLAAFLIPLFSKHNLYCSHLCPHGTVQQLAKNRLPWRIKIGRRLTPVLGAIPVILLGWCVLIATTNWEFSLVDIEPFDAWVFRVAGWATITVAIVGLLASLFVPMAYCRFGCPTGMLLGFLRFNARSDRWSQRDSVAAALVALAFGIWFLI
ncbi:MAG: FMN-binding protein, partial [Planctomycetota bacterium]